MIFEFQVTTAA